MTDLYAGILALLGLIVFAIILFINNHKADKYFYRGMMVCLYLAIGFNALLLLCAIFVKNPGPVVGFLFFLSPHKIFIFLADGAIVGYFISALFKSLGTNARVPADQKNQFYRLAAWTMASYFLFTGVGKILFYGSMLKFFQSSGYTAGVLDFVLAVEIICAIGLLFEKTALVAAAILVVNMTVATITHYHNYFAYHIPDPFSNSIDSLKMQPFLIVILVVAFRKYRSRVETAS